MIIMASEHISQAVVLLVDHCNNTVALKDLLGDMITVQGTGIAVKVQENCVDYA